MEEERKRTATYTFYSSLFPFPRSVTNVSVPLYQAAKQLFPEKFEKQIICDIFEAWNQQVALKELKDGPKQDANRFCRPKQYFGYLYDGIVYQSLVQTVSYKNPTDSCLYTKLNIKLSNDGFLYPDPAELKVFKENVRRHYGTTWCLLDRDELQNWFRPLMDFAVWWLQMSKKDLVFKLWYNFDFSRIDFFAFQKVEVNGEKLALTISFEPGGPMIDFEDDGWTFEDEE